MHFSKLWNLLMWQLLLTACHSYLTDACVCHIIITVAEKEKVKVWVGHLWHDHLYQISSKSTHSFFTWNMWMVIWQTWSLLYTVCSCNLCIGCTLTVRFNSSLLFSNNQLMLQNVYPNSYCWNKITIFNLEDILWKAIDVLEFLHQYITFTANVTGSAEIIKLMWLRSKMFVDLCYRTIVRGMWWSVHYPWLSNSYIKAIGNCPETCHHTYLWLQLRMLIF